MADLKFRGDTEQKLIEALKQGRQEEIGQLYDAYAPVMMGVILRIVKDTELAEEVLQETFVNIWTRIGEYKPSDSRFLTWILSLVREHALEAYINTKRQAIADDGQKDKKPGSGSIDHPNQLDTALLLDLNPLEREILEQIYLEGKSRSEVSAELGITEEKLKASLLKAFIQLKKVRPA